jgi:hypothetical protein
MELGSQYVDSLAPLYFLGVSLLPTFVQLQVCSDCQHQFVKEADRF